MPIFIFRKFSLFDDESAVPFPFFFSFSRVIGGWTHPLFFLFLLQKKKGSRGAPENSSSLSLSSPLFRKLEKLSFLFSFFPAY